jgi:hypothetical protein
LQSTLVNKLSSQQTVAAAQTALTALQTQQANAQRELASSQSVNSNGMEAARRLIEIERTLRMKEAETNAAALALVVKKTDSELASAKALVAQRDAEIVKMESIARDVAEAKMHAAYTTGMGPRPTSMMSRNRLIDEETLQKAERVKARREALLRRQAQHQAAIARRKGAALRSDKTSLQQYVTAHTRPISGDYTYTDFSPLSPGGNSTASFDRLERERRSSLEGGISLREQSQTLSGNRGA